jgi:hypothetical protein
MILKVLKIIIIAILLSACNESSKKSNNIVKVNIYTAALGNEGDSYPKDIIDLYEPLVVSGKEYIPEITIKRIDLSAPQELPKLYADEHSTKAEPKLVLKKEKQAMEASTSKIGANFSTQKTSDFNLAKQRISEYRTQENIFYLKSEINNTTNYDKALDLLGALKTKISQNQSAEQEYLIVYNVVDKAAKEAAQKKADEEAQAAAQKKADEEAQAAAQAAAQKKADEEAQAAAQKKTKAKKEAERMRIKKQSLDNASVTTPNSSGYSKQHSSSDQELDAAESRAGALHKKATDCLNNPACK